jgi:hypothetical protein
MINLRNEFFNNKYIYYMSNTFKSAGGNTLGKGNELG